jgi:hypothetical protein
VSSTLVIKYAGKKYFLREAKTPHFARIEVYHVVAETAVAKGVDRGRQAKVDCSAAQ